MIESKAKCRHLQKITCKGTLRQMFICLRPPHFLGYFLGWSSNFVGSESGQTQSVKLPHNMVSNRTQHPPPPSQPLTVCIYHKSNKELDLQSYLGSMSRDVHRSTHWLRPCNSPPPPAFGLVYEDTIGSKDRRHLFCNLLVYVYYTCDIGRGEGGEPEGQKFTKLGRKYQHD